MDHGGNVNQRHEVDAIDFAIIIGVVGTGGYIWQRYNNPEAIVMAVMLALFMFIMRYSVTFWSILAYIYENVSNEDVGYVAHGSLAADVLPGIARALPRERPVKSFVTSRQPLLLPPPQNATPPVTRNENVTAPHIKRELVDTTEERNGARVTLRKEIVTRPDGKVVELPRKVTPVTLPEFDFGEDVTPIVTGPELLSSETLLKALDEASHVATIGPTGAGKSTLLRVLCYEAAMHGKNVMILDPHATPDSWPHGLTVIGGGRDYNKISEALELIYCKMHSRYNELSIGKVKEREHPAIYIICDEWRAIVQNIPDAGKKLGAIITEARKVNLKIVLGGHSPYLKGLGLEDSAIRESLMLCFLRTKNNERWAEIDGKNYSLPTPLPGEMFGSGEAGSHFQAASIPEKRPARAPEADKKIIQIRELLRQKKSQRDIIKEVWGVDGGNGYIKAAAELSEIIAGLV